MEVLSDISSVSTHDSMPPLMDAFGNIVPRDDDRTTITLDFPERENRHIFFDENGDEISYEEHRRLQAEEEGEEPYEEEEEEEIGMMLRTPMIRQRFLLKHPRVILAFLRFIDLYNELADPGEVLMLPTIPQRIVNSIQDDPAVKFPPEEFQDDVDELLWRLDRHSDLSELHWD